MDEAAPQAAGQPGRQRGEEALSAWLAAHLGAKAWQDDDGWRGTVPVDEQRWVAAGLCASPGELADALETRAADAADVRAIEAEHPGWLARRWSDGTWQAVLPRGEDAVPLHVSASGPERLREAIKAARVTAP